MMRFILRSKRPVARPEALRFKIESARVCLTARPQRVLDFDCEARPLHWISSDYVSKEVTAIAWQWVGEERQAKCVLLGELTPQEMLAAFVDAYQRADLVTGHFIRGYDLPMINGALTEYGMSTLTDKLSHDTKLDLVKRAGLSGSQENIAAMLGLAHPKIKMNQATWRSANRLEPEGLKLARERCVGDVLQHIEMRQRLMELGYLTGPRVWRSHSTAPLAEYTP